jgi:hypothetical protein
MVLTDNGVQFAETGRRRVNGFHHPFDRMCRLLGIEHRLTKPYHPWTNGQAERMVRTLKDATVRAFHYDGVRELRRHVADYLAAYNFAKHLKALRWRTPYETLEALWGGRPELFRRSPDHLTLGPNILVLVQVHLDAPVLCATLRIIRTIRVLVGCDRLSRTETARRFERIRPIERPLIPLEVRQHRLSSPS